MLLLSFQPYVSLVISALKLRIHGQYFSRNGNAMYFEIIALPSQDVATRATECATLPALLRQIAGTFRNFPAKTK